MRSSYKLILLLIGFFLCSSFRPIPGFFRSSSLAGGSTQSFILVKAISPYTTSDFFVAKYEMKNVGGIAFSRPEGLPWVSILRSDAITRCRNLGAGYDLMSNDQWQTIARSIAQNSSNWSGEEVGVGFINSGHSDGTPGKALEASRDDLVGNCLGTGQVCSDSVFNSQRRTHKLANGNVIWDFSGNVWEIVSDVNTASGGLNGYVSTFVNEDSRRLKFGSNILCPESSVTPYCGLGYGAVNYASGAIWRGGHWADLDRAGIFAGRLNVSSALSSTLMGFRCVYTP